MDVIVTPPSPALRNVPGLTKSGVKIDGDLIENG